MRVLVTRPKHQSEQLISVLEAKGHKADLLPLLEIEAIVFSELEQKTIVNKLENTDKLIVVSANAANLALPFLSGLKTLGDKELFAIGPSTASPLKQKGYEVQMPEYDYNSESLLELSRFAQIGNQAIAILCGKGGRDYLEKILVERGARVERIELYTRTPIVREKIDINNLSEPEVLTAMSGDTVEALDAFLENSNLIPWKKIPLIVPAKRVANIASEKGFTKVLVSQKPTTESLLEMLVEL